MKSSFSFCHLARQRHADARDPLIAGSSERHPRHRAAGNSSLTAGAGWRWAGHSGGAERHRRPDGHRVPVLSRKAWTALAFQGSPLTTDTTGLPTAQQRARHHASGITTLRGRDPASPKRPRTSPTLPNLASSAAQSEPLDQGPVTGDVRALEVAEQPPTAADHLQQATTRVMIVLVDLQVLGEPVDPVRQDRHLHLGRARVTLLGRVLRDDLGLLVLDQHPLPLPFRSAVSCSGAHDGTSRVVPHPERSPGQTAQPPVARLALSGILSRFQGSRSRLASATSSCIWSTSASTSGNSSSSRSRCSKVTRTRLP